MTSLQQEVKKLREFMEANQISASTFAVSTLTATTIGATATKSLAIEAVAGKDIVMNMGDKAAANKVSFTDSDDSEVAKVDSNGTVTAVAFAGPLTGDVTGDVTGNVTAGSGDDLVFTGDAAKNIVLNLGDKAGARKVSITDSDDSEMASVDSDGTLTAKALVGPLTGDITAGSGADLVFNGDAAKNIVLNLGDKAAATKVSFTDSDDSEQGYINSDGTFYAKTSIAPMKYAHTDTDGAPTNAECVSAFGAAATVGSGFVGVYQDDHAGGVSYLCISNGTNYDVIAASAAA